MDHVEYPPPTSSPLIHGDICPIVLPCVHGCLLVCLGNFPSCLTAVLCRIDRQENKQATASSQRLLPLHCVRIIIIITALRYHGNNSSSSSIAGGGGVCIMKSRRRLLPPFPLCRRPPPLPLAATARLQQNRRRKTALTREGARRALVVS